MRGRERVRSCRWNRPLVSLQGSLSQEDWADFVRVSQQEAGLRGALTVQPRPVV